MEKERILNEVKNILLEKGEKAIDEVLILIKELATLAYSDYQNEVEEAFEKFLNFETLNSVSDKELAEIKLSAWQKDEILQLLKQNSFAGSQDGMFNVNALVLAMNYEYRAHKNIIDSSGNKFVFAYKLAKEALQMPEYIEHILEIYEGAK